MSKLTTTKIYRFKENKEQLQKDKLIKKRKRLSGYVKKCVDKKIENAQIDIYLIDRITKKVCIQLRITHENYQLNINRRKREYVEARSYVTYILKEKYCYTEYQIAKALQKDRTNSDYLIKTLESDILYNNTKKNYLKIFMLEC